MQDVSCIRAEHSQDWDRISEEQKTEIVWERLVCPEIKEKYNYYPPEYSEVEVFPVIQLNTGDKMVTDEEHANGNARSTKAGVSSYFKKFSKTPLLLLLENCD